MTPPMNTFYQLEGCVVDKDISIAQLTYLLRLAMYFTESRCTRFAYGLVIFLCRTWFEVDCSCTQCAGKGCAVCKYTGWVEMLGAG